MPYDGYDMGYDVWYQLTDELQTFIVGRPLTPQTRSVVSYDVYRLLADDEENPENWHAVATGITDLFCSDTSINETDIYRYAVVANFPNGDADAAFSPEAVSYTHLTLPTKRIV